MKKWNKKIYIFFSLFFVLSLFLYPSFNVLASNESSEDYIPDSTEKYYFFRSLSYDEGYYSDGLIQYESKNYYSTTSDYDDELVVYLDCGTFFVSSLNFLRGNSNAGVLRSGTTTKSYSDGTVKKYSTIKDGPYPKTTCEYEYCINNDFDGDKATYNGYHTNMKMFSSKESAVAYAANGDLSGIMSNPFETEELTDSNSVYSLDIGYLQNVQIHTRGVKDDDGETDYLTYDSITNTGFDITQDGVRVSLYTKYQGYYFENWTEWIGDDNAHKWVSDRKYQKSVDGSSDKFIYEYTKLFDIHADDKAKTESLNKSLLATPFGKIEYWLRIEKKNSDGTWTYGGWVSMADSKASMTEGDKQTKTYDNEENLDSDGGYGTGTDTYQDYGEGNTAEEADEKAFELPDSQKDLDNYDSGYETMDSFVDGIKSMKNGLGDVPRIISEVFKALPTPVITAIGCGFFLAIVLRILGR